MLNLGKRPPSEYTIYLHGELDLDSRQLVADACLAGVRSRSKSVVLDLDHVDFLDCSCLGVLVQAAHRISCERRGFVVRHPHPPVRRLLDLSGFSRTFEVAWD